MIIDTVLYANFFTNRVIDQWKELPSDVKNARNVKNFKIKFDGLNMQKLLIFIKDAQKTILM